MVIAPDVIVDDPDTVKIIYGLETEFIEVLWYYANGGIYPDNGVDSCTYAYEKRHSANRGKVVNAYSTTCAC